jgi:hypothetical protein
MMSSSDCGESGDSWVRGSSPSQPNISFEQLKDPALLARLSASQASEVRHARERASHRKEHANAALVSVANHFFFKCAVAGA